mmetsp:Transcript_30757/g.30245  ORF Transcript_30757/g.30245 Transcript_30757/m.30245 type:complete len:91 (-) Transcript_30757:138-410(-)
MIDQNPFFKYSEMGESQEDDDFTDIKVSEFLFVIDRSGSMDGKPMALAIEALKLFIHSLPIGSKFNVVSFGSEFKLMFKKSETYNEKSVQ